MTAEEAKIIEAADAWFDLINKEASEKQIAKRLLSLIDTIAARREKSAAPAASRDWIPYTDDVQTLPWGKTVEVHRPWRPIINATLILFQGDVRWRQVGGEHEAEWNVWNTRWRPIETEGGDE